MVARRGKYLLGMQSRGNIITFLKALLRALPRMTRIYLFRSDELALRRDWLDGCLSSTMVFFLTKFAFLFTDNKHGFVVRSTAQVAP